MSDYVVIRSDLIETVSEAWAYYRAKFVGEREILARGTPVAIQFPGEEIHLFTEKVDAARAPLQANLVHRPKSSEVRYFSKTRARLLDRIIPTLENPASSVAAKVPGATMVFGPVNRDCTRLAVVVRRLGACWLVRTAYPLTPKEFASYKRSNRASPWPP